MNDHQHTLARWRGLNKIHRETLLIKGKEIVNISKGDVTKHHQLRQQAREAHNCIKRLFKCSISIITTPLLSCKFLS